MDVPPVVKSRMEPIPPMNPEPSRQGPDIAPHPIRWVVLVGMILGPPVLTWLAALAKFNPVAVAIPFLGGMAAAVVSWRAFLGHFGRTSALKVLMGIVCAFILGVVTFALSFAGCSIGGFEFDMR